MWETTLIESKGSDRRVRQWWTIPVAACIHAAILSAALFASYWNVEAMEGPLARIIYLDPVRVSISPPPQPGGGTRKLTEVATAKPSRETQPAQIQDLTKDSPIQADALEAQQSSNSAMNAPIGEGVPDGVDGGWGTTPMNKHTGFGRDENEPYVITAEVVPPVLVRRVEPEYPRVARLLRQQGVVILEAVITNIGNVEQVRTLRADHAALEDAARQAVMQWKYKPALYQNRPVKVYFTVTCTFRLQ